MANLLTQSLKLLKDATVSYGKDYMSNSFSLINDANEIRTEVMQTAKTNIETLKGLKRNINFKTVRDWFYQKEQDAELADGEEFDPGFDTGVMDDEETSSHPLGAEEMDRITNRQTGAMYQIASHQNETMLASTAEIITTLNQRNSEILASVNNINSTLIGISKKLDAFANVYAEKTEREQREGLYDTSGELSLQRIFNTAKSQQGGIVGITPDLLSFLPMFFQNGPAPLVRMLLENTVGAKPRNILGGQSINDTLDDLNDRIGDAIQTGLEKAISSKTFKSLFGDLRATERDKDWGKTVVNGYNDKPAPFDGYVRTTIIKTIPEYLRIIAKGVTGVNYNVDKYGALSMGTSTLDSKQLERWKNDQNANERKYRAETWGKMSNDNFRNTPLYGSALSDLYQNKPTNISEFDTDQVQRALLGSFIQVLNHRGTNSVTLSELRDPIIQSQAVTMAAKIMASASNKRNVDWLEAVMIVMERIATGPHSRQFIKAINTARKADEDRRTSFTASSSPMASLAGIVTDKETVATGVYNIRNAYKDEANLTEIRELRQQLNELLGETGGHRTIRDRINNIRERVFDETKQNEIERIQNRLRELGGGNRYNQSSYGNYLNMAQNGCGPVALAEMLQRRGIYDPMKGMSAGNFITASGLLGQPLVAGEVNNMTLRNASPSNPITVLGSGTTFGTASGNNHFMNVIGTDGHGNVYVSNPIDGKIHKRPINDVGGSSLLGLYGSGAADTLIGMAKTKANEIGTSIIDRSDNFIDRSLQRSLDKAKVYGDKDSVSEEDKAQMNLVLSLMESALEDGDGTADKQAILQEISRIKDQRLKARLRTSVSGMLERSEKKKSGGGILSKLFSAGKGILRNFFAPLIAGISTIVTKIAIKAKNLIKPVLNFIKGRIQRRVSGIVEGTKGFIEGAGDVVSVVGTVMKPIVSKVTDVVTGIGKALPGMLSKILTDGFNKVGDFVKKRIEKISESKFGKAITKAVNFVGQKVFGTAANWIKDKFGKLRSATDDVSEGAHNLGQSLMSKFRSTSFGAGFMSSFDKVNDRFRRREEAENPGLKEQRTIQAILDGGQPSILTTINESIQQLHQDNVGEPEGQTTVANEQTTMNPGEAGTPTGSWNTPSEEQTTRIVDSVDALKEETAKGNREEAIRDATEQTQEVRQHQEMTHVVEANVQNNQNAMDNAQEESSLVTLTNNQADRKGPGLGSKLLGGLGKMFGGALNAIMNIAGMVTEIVMGMSGVKAIMQLIKATLTEILKPVNSVFKEIVKTVKPVLKILTGTMKDLVASVTGPIVEILKSLAPLLEIVAKAVNGILKFLSPVINFIAKGIGKVVTGITKFITPVIKLIAGFFKKIGEGLGFLLHPFSKKKRREYNKRIGLDNDFGSDEDDRKESAEAKRADAEFKNDPNKSAKAMQIAKEVHPFSKKKREDLYEKLMTNEISLSDAQDLAKSSWKKSMKFAIVNPGAGVTALTARAISSDTSVLANGLSNGLSMNALTGIPKGTVALIKYLKQRHAKEDEVKRADDEKAEKNRKEDLDMQKAVYKHGFLEIASNTHSLSDAASVVKGLLSSGAGVIMSGTGGIIGGLGKVIAAIGDAFAFLPFVDENNKISQLGQSMLEKSDKLIEDGQSLYTKGMNMIKREQLDLGVSNFAGSVKDAVSATAAAAQSAASKNVAYGEYTSIDGRTVYTSGDIPMSNIDRATQAAIIGSGDSQTSFGNYLNMARRGCGPVALAEAYQRRTGNSINTRKLANSMTANGTYNPSMGTSVSGYLSAANSLGMNTQIGGVTMASLKKASPNNPITLVGSGTSFGTRTGNNHYLNAIGTDRYGGVYVSNPMTGKIQRRNANDIAGSSLMGIYGSGDTGLELSTFSDATKEAIANLSSLTGMFTNLFGSTDGASSIEEMTSEKKKENEAAKIASVAQDEYSEEDYQTKVMNAMDLYRADHPMKDGETPEEYEKRITDEWNAKSTIRNKYIAIAVSGNISDDLQKQYDSFILNSKDYYEPYVVYQRDADGNIMHDESGNPIVSGGFKYTLSDENSEYVKSKKASIAIKKLGEAITAASASGGGGSSSGGTSSGGGNLDSLYAAAAAVFEAAVKNNGGIYATCKDVGPVTLRNGLVLKNFRQDCSGLMSAAIRAMGYDLGAGSATGITTYDMENLNKQTLVVDKDGNYSSDWELLPYQKGALRPGDIVTSHGHMSMYISGPDTSSWSNRGFDGGSGLGNESPGKGIQNSAIAGAAYLDGDSDWQSKLHYTHAGVDGLKRILRFKGAITSDQTGGTSSGGSSQGKINLSQAMQSAPVFWSPYPSKLTAGGYWDAAKKAGLTAAQTAMVAAIGIHEDAAKKLTGEKSLTAVTFDKNGQAAFGLMNWIPDAKNAHRGGHETKYGSTLAEQLPYIKQKYFDSNSTFDRAKNVNFNEYKSGITQALGHAPKLGANDRWGPFAETDVAEAMGHYVANALVPEYWFTSTQLAKHMRTAADAYNWMLDNGQTGYASGGGSSGSSGGGGIDISSMLGEYADYLPDYYKNMLGVVQTSINTTAATAASLDSSYSDFGDYDEADLGDAEALEGDTRVYATAAERNTLYSTMSKKYKGSAWSNTQLTSKGYGDVYLYLEPSTNSKIVCKLENNKQYTKVTTSGSWYFVYARSGTLCGWGRSSDFALTSDVKNKSYQTNTSNQVNSASDAMYAKWKGTSDSTKFYKPLAGQVWLDTNDQMTYDDYKHYYTHGTVYNDGKYKDKNGKKIKWTRIGTSYDQTFKNRNRPVAYINTPEKTLAQLKSTFGACGDFDFNVPDTGFFVPSGLYGSGDVSTVANDIPPLNNSILDQMLGYDSEGSYTVNNYTIQGGINNGTADLSRTELLNYLIKTEFTTRSPRTEKILNKILSKLDGLKSTNNIDTTPDPTQMYDDEIPEIISNLIRG